MTAFELRCHLADAHQVNARGADYATLLDLHDDEHRGDTDHHHEEHER